MSAYSRYYQTSFVGTVVPEKRSILPYWNQMLELSQLIENFPSILNSLNTIDDMEDKNTAFGDLIYLIEETDLIGEHLTAILDVIDTFGDVHRQRCFFYMISASKVKGLNEEQKKVIRDRFPECSSW